MRWEIQVLMENTPDAIKTKSSKERNGVYNAIR